MYISCIPNLILFISPPQNVFWLVEIWRLLLILIMSRTCSFLRNRPAYYLFLFFNSYLTSPFLPPPTPPPLPPTPVSIFVPLPSLARITPPSALVPAVRSCVRTVLCHTTKKTHWLVPPSCKQTSLDLHVYQKSSLLHFRSQIFQQHRRIHSIVPPCDKNSTISNLKKKLIILKKRVIVYIVYDKPPAYVLTLNDSVRLPK